MAQTLDERETRSPARRWWFLLLLGAANLIWSGQGTAVKIIERSTPEGASALGPIGITFLPFYLTTLLLIPVLVWQRRRRPDRARPTRHDWWRFAVAGVLGQVFAQLGMTWGTTLSLASNQAILNLLIPVMSAVLASLMLGERLTRLRVACLAVGLLGVGLMSVKDLEESSFVERSYLRGNLLLLVGCFGSSFYNVYCKGLLSRFGEVEILIFSYITASLASIPLLIWLEPQDLAALGALEAPGWWALGFLAVFMYGVSMLLFFWVLEHIPVTVASASLYLVPVFGVLFATTIVGERLGPMSLAGAAIVLVSTALVMRYDPSA
jgi:drug/metabolite transporter (DMT)-like permease